MRKPTVRWRKRSAHVWQLSTPLSDDIIVCVDDPGGDMRPDEDSVVADLVECHLLDLNDLTEVDL